MRADLVIDMLAAPGSTHTVRDGIANGRIRYS
jgi:hypothetical protein